MILPKTQLQTDLERIDLQSTRAANALRHAISELNRSHAAAWQLPEPRLKAVLEHLIAAGLLEGVFTKHAAAAAGLNMIAEAVGVPDRAIAMAGREFAVDESGRVTLAPLSEPEPEPEPEPAPEPDDPQA